MMRATMSIEPPDPSIFDPWVIKNLVKRPIHYDWERLSVLGTTRSEILSFYRSILRAINPLAGPMDEHSILLNRSFRTDFAIATEFAAELDITRKQRSLFARLLAVIFNWNPSYYEPVHELWNRMLDQKVTLKYLRTSAENQTSAPSREYLSSILDAHQMGMSPEHADEYARASRYPEWTLTAHQFRSLAKRNIAPSFAQTVLGHSKPGTKQTTLDIRDLHDAKVGWDYMLALLGDGARGRDIARYWKNDIPLEYARA
jgi:hypothetical protein